MDLPPDTRVPAPGLGLVGDPEAVFVPCRVSVYPLASDARFLNQ